MKRDETKQQHWKHQINSWQASGLTQRLFCEREGLKFGTFDYWRRALLSDAQEAKASATSKNSPGLTLVPVQVKAAPASVELVLRGSGVWELQLPSSVEAGWLTDVLRRLA